MELRLQLSSANVLVHQIKEDEGNYKRFHPCCLSAAGLCFWLLGGYELQNYCTTNRSSYPFRRAETEAHMSMPELVANEETRTMNKILDVATERGCREVKT